MLSFSVAVIDVVVRRSWRNSPGGGDRASSGPSCGCGDEDAFLAAVYAMLALADSDSPSWKQEECWDNAYRLLAAAEGADVLTSPTYRA